MEEFERKDQSEVHSNMVSFVAQYWFGNKRSYAGTIQGAGLNHTYPAKYNLMISALTDQYMDILGRHMCNFRYATDILRKYMDAYYSVGHECYGMEYYSHVLQAAYVIKLMPTLIDCGIAAYESGKTGVFCGDGSGVAATVYSELSGKSVVVTDVYDWSFFVFSSRVLYRQIGENEFSDEPSIVFFKSRAKNVVLTVLQHPTRGYTPFRSVYIPISLPIEDAELPVSASQLDILPFEVPVLDTHSEVLSHVYGDALAVNMLWEVDGAKHVSYFGSIWVSPVNEKYDVVLVGAINGIVADYGVFFNDIRAMLRPKGKVFLFSPSVTNTVSRRRMQMMTDMMCVRGGLSFEESREYHPLYHNERLYYAMRRCGWKPRRLHTHDHDPLKHVIITFVPTGKRIVLDEYLNDHDVEDDYMATQDPWVGNWLRVGPVFQPEVKYKSRKQWYSLLGIMQNKISIRYNPKPIKDMTSNDGYPVNLWFAESDEEKEDVIF